MSPGSPEEGPSWIGSTALQESWELAGRQKFGKVAKEGSRRGHVSTVYPNSYVEIGIPEQWCQEADLWHGWGHKVKPS